MFSLLIVYLELTYSGDVDNDMWGPFNVSWRVVGMALIQTSQLTLPENGVMFVNNVQITASTAASSQL